MVVLLATANKFKNGWESRLFLRGFLRLLILELVGHFLGIDVWLFLNPTDDVVYTEEQYGCFDSRFEDLGFYLKVMVFVIILYRKY